MDKQAVVATLNKILEMELAGVVRYTHYSLMVFGPYRMPIVDWLRAQATESLLHAQQAGEMITQLGEHPSLAIGPLLETHDHDIEVWLDVVVNHTTEAGRTGPSYSLRILDEREYYNPKEDNWKIFSSISGIREARDLQSC